MEENNIPEGGAQVEGTPAAQAETTQPTFIEQFKTRFGVDVPDETSVLSTVETWHKQSSELQGKVAELEGRKLAYSSPATEQIDQYVAKLAQDGVTDPSQVMAKVREFVEESSINYKDLAENHPDQFLLRHYKAEGYTEKLARHSIDTLTSSLEADAERRGLDEEATADFVKTGLQAAAIPHLKAAMERQKPLEFKPAQQQSLDDIRKSFTESANGWAGSVKEINAGSETIPVDEKMVEDFWNGWLAKGDGDKSMSLLARPHTPEGFKEFAELNMLRRNLPSILASAREKARSEALAEFEKRVTMPNGNAPSTSAPDTSTGSMSRSEIKELFDKFPPAAFNW